MMVSRLVEALHHACLADLCVVRAILSHVRARLITGVSNPKKNQLTALGACYGASLSVCFCCYCICFLKLLHRGPSRGPRSKQDWLVGHARWSLTYKDFSSVASLTQVLGS